MKYNLSVWITAFVLAFTARTYAQDHGNPRLGLGVNYWVAVDSLDSEFDDEGISYLLTYKNNTAGLLGVQVDVEILPDRFGEDAYAPAAYLVLGKELYAAAGIGIINTDGDWLDDPFFALRVGVDLQLGSNLFLDLGASYRFNGDTEFDDVVDAIDTDTVFLGGAVRWAF